MSYSISSAVEKWAVGCQETNHLLSVIVSTSNPTTASPPQVLLVQTIDYNFIKPERLVVILGNDEMVRELCRESEASGCYSI